MEGRGGERRREMGLKESIKEITPEQTKSEMLFLSKLLNSWEFPIT